MALDFDLTRVARSLLNIEVNTIIRNEITGEPMPPMPHALLDILQWYADTLSDLGVDMPGYFAAPLVDTATVAPGWVLPHAGSVGVGITVSTENFFRVREAARWTAESKDPRALRIPTEKRVLLDRIVNNCDAVKEIIKRADPSLTAWFGKTRQVLAGKTLQPSSYKIAPDDLITVQKMWDIGVELIVAQTVVHLNGDVTTRVQQALLDPKSDTTFSIHRQSIDVSVACWRSLLDALKEIAGAAVGTLLGVKKP